MNFDMNGVPLVVDMVPSLFKFPHPATKTWRLSAFQKYDEC